MKNKKYSSVRCSVGFIGASLILGMVHVSALAALPFIDAFNDADAPGWQVVNDVGKCDPEGSIAVAGKNLSRWGVVNQVYMQVGDCRGFSPEGVNIGSYSFGTVRLGGHPRIEDFKN